MTTDYPFTFMLDENGEPVHVDIYTGTASDRDRFMEWYSYSWRPGPQCRRVARDTVGDWEVSTVFLAHNHQFGSGPPVLWETMVFGPEPWDNWSERYTSREAAEAGHARAVAMLQRDEPPCHEED